MIHHPFLGRRFDVSRELAKCDTEAWSEQMLGGKWCRQSGLTQGCRNKPSTCKKNAVSAKCNKIRSACAIGEMSTVGRRLHLPGSDRHSATVWSYYVGHMTSLQHTWKAETGIKRGLQNQLNRGEVINHLPGKGVSRESMGNDVRRQRTGSSLHSVQWGILRWVFTDTGINSSRHRQET